MSNPSSTTSGTTTRLTDEHGHLLGVITGNTLTIKHGDRQGSWELEQLTMNSCQSGVVRDTIALK